MDARSKAITNDRLAVKEKRGRMTYIVLGDRNAIKEWGGKKVKRLLRSGEKERRKRKARKGGVKGC